MLTPESVAAALLDAADAASAVPCFTDADAEFSAAAAYAAQDKLVALRVARGERIIGAKLGLTSAAKQAAMGVGEPLYGWLTDSMLLPSGALLPEGVYLHPRVEPEIAFLLKDELEAPTSATAVLAATGWICAALEVIDSRYRDFRFRLPDVVADNASAAVFALGPLLKRPDAVGDLRLLGCVMRIDGMVVETAAGAAVMGNPAEAVAWLVNSLGRNGRGLPAGSIVLSGALSNARALPPRSSVDVEIEGLGHVGIRA